MVAAELVERFPITDIRGGLTVRKARSADVPWLAQKLAELDREEIHYSDPEISVADAIRLSLENSTHAWSAIRKGRTLAMFGVGLEDVGSGIGNPWLLMSGEVYRSPRSLLRLAPSYLNAMQGHFRLLRGGVYDRHEPAKRFLTWLGFQLSEPFVAPSGGVFRIYTREEPN